MMSTEPSAFVAYAICGHLVFASVDEPDLAESNAREVARCIKQGLRVEKLSCEAVRQAKWCPADCIARRTKKGVKV